MTKADPGHDESMEEILASIRKIIADDLATISPGVSQAAQARPAGGESSQRKEPVFDAPSPPPAFEPSAFDDMQNLQDESAEAESEILDLGEELLVAEGEPELHGQHQPDDRLQMAGEHHQQSAELSPDLSPEGERRLWDQQPPITPASQTRPVRSAAPEHQPRAPDRGPPRPAWSGLDASREASAPHAEAPRNRSFNEPGSDGAWQKHSAPDPWAGDVQMPVPPSGPLAPFPQTPPAKPAVMAAPQQPPAAKTAAQASGSSRLAVSITATGSPLAGKPHQPAAPKTDEAAASGQEAGETPQYIQSKAEELARAAISSLGDRELAEARNVKFSQVNRPVLADVTSSFADALSEPRQPMGRESAAAGPSSLSARPPLAGPAPASPPLVARQEPSLSFAPPASPPPAKESAAPTPAPAAAEPGRSLEDSFRALLRPMIEEWLNENMPRLLEQAIQEEVQRRMGGDT